MTKIPAKFILKSYDRQVNVCIPCLLRSPAESGRFEDQSSLLFNFDHADVLGWPIGTLCSDQYLFIILFWGQFSGTEMLCDRKLMLPSCHIWVFVINSFLLVNNVHVDIKLVITSGKLWCSLTETLSLVERWSGFMIQSNKLLDFSYKENTCYLNPLTVLVFSWDLFFKKKTGNNQHY